MKTLPQQPTRRISPSAAAHASIAGPLTVRMYDLENDGQYRPSSEHKVVKAMTRLHVAAGSAEDGVILPLRPNVGMAVEPLTFEVDPRDSGNWLVWNKGHTNSLRIQPWGLRPFPLRPQTAVAMPSTDIAVWIPILPPRAEPGDRGETFRILIAHTPELPTARGRTRDILNPKRKAFTDEQMEALLYYYGELFYWPPHPAPHVRSTAELKRSIHHPDSRFMDAKGRLIDPHALFRTSKSGKRDWYSPTGRPGAVETYVPAVERLVELGSLTLRLVWHSCNQLGVRDYVEIDDTLIHL